MDEEELARRVRIVVDDYHGILSHCEAFYVLSVQYSASRAVSAFERYDIAKGLDDTAEMQVSAIHEALGHAASLSRFFWPPGLGDKTLGELKAGRATRLREAFQIREDSPLKNRRLRDSLEHFDERLDSYFLHHDSGAFFPTPIVGDSSLADDPVGNIFKLVDPEKQIFVVLGEKYEFSGIREEVTKINDATQTMDKHGGRLDGGI